MVKLFCFVLLFSILSLLLIANTALAQSFLNGKLTTSLSLAPGKSCELVHGSVICEDAKAEAEPALILFNTLFDLSFPKLLGGPLDVARSITEFLHPGYPCSGLTFQAFILRATIAEIASLEQTIIFSPNMVLYTLENYSTRWFGEQYPNITFRRLISKLDISLVGLTVNTKLLVDDWVDQPQSPSNTHAGLVIDVSGVTVEESKVSLTTRFGAKEGVVCFGNCIGPLKLIPDPVQTDFQFEEMVIVAENIEFYEADITLSGKLSALSGFRGITLTAMRTWEDILDSRLTLSSSFMTTSALNLIFGGLSLVWDSDPFTFSISFDSTFDPAVALKTVQFQTELPGAIDTDFSSQMVFGQLLNLDLAIPTGEKTTFKAAFRFLKKDSGYDFHAGAFILDKKGDPISFTVYYLFKPNVSIAHLESELEF